MEAGLKNGFKHSKEVTIQYSRATEKDDRLKQNHRKWRSGIIKMESDILRLKRGSSDSPPKVIMSQFPPPKPGGKGERDAFLSCSDADHFHFLITHI